MTTIKKSISALELQGELGHKRYEPIWAMLHKIRLSMRHRDSRYELKEYIELDEGFFETSDRREENQSKVEVVVGKCLFWWRQSQFL